MTLLKGAMEDVNSSLKFNEDNSYAYRNRALIYLALGKKEKACSDIQTAMDKNFIKFYGNSILDLWRENCLQ